MKLELKHLAPYLPYGLKLWYDEKLPLSEFLDKKVDAHSLEMGVVTMMACLRGNSKPILRPLSDLRKLTDEFTTEHDLSILLGENGEYGLVEVQFYEGIDFIHEADSDQGYDSEKSINFQDFEKVRSELLKSHYDIFGLIEQDLAIDINTL